MTRNIILIDSKTPSHRFLKQMTAVGINCHRARGPVKLRATLAAQSIDLILWRDRALGPDLAEDLYRECRQYPSIPVVHLFSDESPGSLPSGMKPIDSLPDQTQTAELLKLIASITVTDAEAHNSTQMSHSELAFRNVVSRLRRKSGEGVPASRTRKSTGDFPSTSIALNRSERTLLTTHPSENGAALRWQQISTRLSRITRPLRAALERIGS